MKFVYNVFIAFSVFILSLLLMFYQNTTDLLRQKGSDRQITVYMDSAVPKEGVDQLVSDIQDKIKAEKITVTGSEHLLNEFKKTFGFYTEGVFDEAEIIELLPKTIDVEIGPNAKIEEIAAEIRTIPSVEDVVYGGEWFKKLERFDNLLTNLIRVIFLFVFLVVSFLTITTVRALIFAARDEIEVYSLLGATRTEIYRKYVFSLSYAVVASIIAGYALSYVAFIIVQKKFLFNTSFSFIADRIHFLSAENIAVILIGVTVSFFLGVFLSIKAITNTVFLNDGY